MLPSPMIDVGVGFVEGKDGEEKREEKRKETKEREASRKGK